MYARWTMSDARSRSLWNITVPELRDVVCDPAMNSNTPPRILHGQCLCGAVRYTVLDEFEYALNCHCSQCRRATGSAFKPFGGIAREKLSTVAGETNVLIFGGEDAHDVHCATCGSLLYSVLNQ